MFTTGISKSNKWCGKTGYKSPEIVRKDKSFDAKKNDIWCLGVSLFMMLTGHAPFNISHESDPVYLLMTGGKSTMEHALKSWNMGKYVDDDAIDLLQSIFKNESKRYTLNDIISHPFMK